MIFAASPSVLCVVLWPLVSDASFLPRVPPMPLLHEHADNVLFASPDQSGQEDVLGSAMLHFGQTTCAVCVGALQ